MHGFEGMFAHGALGGEHYGVGSVPDGVGDIARLGPGGLVDFSIIAFQHLGRGDGLVSMPGALFRIICFWERGHLLHTEFHSQIAPRHHDAPAHVPEFPPDCPGAWGCSIFWRWMVWGPPSSLMCRLSASTSEARRTNSGRRDPRLLPRPSGRLPYPGESGDQRPHPIRWDGRPWRAFSDRPPAPSAESADRVFPLPKFQRPVVPAPRSGRPWRPRITPGAAEALPTDDPWARVCRLRRARRCCPSPGLPAFPIDRCATWVPGDPERRGIIRPSSSEIFLMSFRTGVLSPGLLWLALSLTGIGELQGFPQGSTVLQCRPHGDYQLGLTLLIRNSFFMV